LDAARAFVTTFPGSPKIPDALQISGDLLARGGAYDEAANYLSVVVILQPEHPAWADAALALGRLYARELGDDERAGIVLRALLERMPDSPQADEARELLGELGER
jgi:TolA-binding protein